MNEITKVVSRSISKTGFALKKHSPEILIVSGILTAAASIFLACRATTKLDSIIKPAKKKIEDVHAHMDNANEIQNHEYSIEQGRKELTVTYAKTGGKLLLLYSPAAIAFGLSVACIIGSHNIMRGRNLALAAACTTLESGYKAYRDRVKEKLGEEAEAVLFQGTKKVDEKKGDEESPENKTALKTAPNGFSVMYAENQRGWDRDAHLNLAYLLAQQSYLNEVLKAKGYLFLSEVYETLGFGVDYLGEARIRASHVLGWIYDPSDKTRDSYISFGLTDGHSMVKPNVYNQVKANEPNFFLEFNYDGDIMSGDNGKKTFAQFAKSL